MTERSDRSDGSRRFLRRLARKQLAALAAIGLVVLLAAAAALAVTGALTQPGGAAGCISETAAGPCADGHGLPGADTVVVSADGKNVYAASDNAVVRLKRNTANGAITQPAGTAGCISDTGAGPCANGHALSGVFGLAITLDGKSVYAVSQNSNAVVRLKRNTTTGALTQPAGTAGCISETGAGPCANGHALSGASSVTVSNDGKSVYVTSLDGVVRLKRDTTTGGISQPAGAAGCISETGAGPCANGHALASGADAVRVSPNGNSVYVASFPNNAVIGFSRDTATGAITEPAGAAACISETGAGPCANGHALTGAVAVVLSPNGKNVYVAANTGNAVVRLKRDTVTGALTELAGTAACISDTGAGQCANGHALVGPVWLTVSSDGKSVYAASHVSNAVVGFKRNTSNGANHGALTEPATAAACISDTGAGPCANGHALSSPFSVEVSLDGKSVYVASRLSDAVARIKRTP
jgi:WD40 repeat protein